MNFAPRGLLRAVLRHPSDGFAVARAAWDLRRTKWWRHWPPLPTPDPHYWEFRMTTAYGDPHATPSVHDVIAAARWSRAQRAKQ